MKFRSPNEFMEAAIRLTNGGEPLVNDADWERAVAFWAINLHQSTLPQSLILLCRLFECPLSDHEVLTIAQAAILEFAAQQAVRRIGGPSLN